MYSYISGTLIEKSPTHVVIDAHGVGYELIVPISTHQKLPTAGQNVKLLIHFVVREDAQILYGFSTEEERELFRLLMSVSGIGPKMAITILSGIGISELKQAIVDGAVPVLTAISGIGKKIAERLVVELREKVILEDRRIDHHKTGGQKNALVEDSVKALVSLGYGKQSAKEAVQKVLSAHPHHEKMKVEELIRQSLKYV